MPALNHCWYTICHIYLISKFLKIFIGHSYNVLNVIICVVLLWQSVCAEFFSLPQPSDFFHKSVYLLNKNFVHWAWDIFITPYSDGIKLVICFKFILLDQCISQITFSSFLYVKDLLVKFYSYKFYELIGLLLSNLYPIIYNKMYLVYIRNI